MIANNNSEMRLEAALNYAKFEAISGESVQILSVLRKVKKEDNQNSAVKKNKELAEVNRVDDLN